MHSPINVVRSCRLVTLLGHARVHLCLAAHSYVSGPCSRGKFLRMQLGRPLLEEPDPTDDGPPGLKQEALPGMTGTMIPVPLQDHLGLPIPSDGNMLQSASSSQGAPHEGGLSNVPLPCPRC